MNKCKICILLTIIIALTLSPFTDIHIVYGEKAEPVLSFTFDEDDKNIDAVINSDGILTTQANFNKYTYHDGKLNKCLYLDGSFGLKLNTGRLNAQNYTISFWVNPTEITAHTSILSIVRGSFEDMNYSTVLLDENWLQPNITSIYTDESGSYSHSSGISGALTSDTWTHIAIVVDSSTSEEEYFDKMILYIDGQYICDGLMLKNMCNSNSSFWIGITPFSDAFNGYIDELRIFNSSLSADDITALYMTDDSSDNHQRPNGNHGGNGHNGNDDDNWHGDNPTRPGNQNNSQSGNLFDDVVHIDQGSLPKDDNSSLSVYLNPGLAAGMEYKTDAYADIAFTFSIILAVISICCFLTYRKKKRNQY